MLCLSVNAHSYRFVFSLSTVFYYDWKTVIELPFRPSVTKKQALAPPVFFSNMPLLLIYCVRRTYVSAGAAVRTFIRIYFIELALGYGSNGTLRYAGAAGGAPVCIYFVGHRYTSLV